MSPPRGRRFPAASEPAASSESEEDSRPEKALRKLRRQSIKLSTKLKLFYPEPPAGSSLTRDELASITTWNHHDHKTDGRKVDLDITTSDFYALTRTRPPSAGQAQLIELSRFRHGNKAQYRLSVPGHGDQDLKAGVSWDGMGEHLDPDAPLWLPPAITKFLIRATTETNRTVMLAEENKDWSKKLKEAKKVARAGDAVLVLNQDQPRAMSPGHELSKAERKEQVKRQELLKIVAMIRKKNPPHKDIVHGAQNVWVDDQVRATAYIELTPTVLNRWARAIYDRDRSVTYDLPPLTLRSSTLTYRKLHRPSPPLLPAPYNLAANTYLPSYGTSRFPADRLASTLDDHIQGSAGFDSRRRKFDLDKFLLSCRFGSDEKVGCARNGMIRASIDNDLYGLTSTRLTVEQLARAMGVTVVLVAELQEHAERWREVVSQEEQQRSAEFEASLPGSEANKLDGLDDELWGQGGRGEGGGESEGGWGSEAGEGGGDFEAELEAEDGYLDE